MSLRNYILLSSLFLITIFSNGQEIEEQKIDRYLSFGPTITSYRGDLNSNYSKTGGGINIMIVPERDKLIQTSLELNIGRVTGQQSGYYSEAYPTFEPNTFVQTSFTSFSLNIRAYLIRKKNFKLYIGQGIGAIRFVPKDEYGNKLDTASNTRYLNASNSGESYENLSIILPRTLGASYRLKNAYRLSLDINQQGPRTDYIDNISILGESERKKDKILLVRFSVMIPILYQKEIAEVADPAI